MIAASALFLLAFAVRALHAADLAPLLDTPRQPGLQMTRRYDVQAVDMLNGDGVLFPRVRDPEDTGLLSRPPGYSMLLAAIYGGIGRDLASTQLAQNLLCSLTAPMLLVLGIAALSFRVGILAGALGAVAPHFAWYSNWIVPDAPCVVVVLLGMWLAWRGLAPRRSLAWHAAAGTSLGLGVWLRPNLLFVGVFLAVGLFASRPGWRRLKQVVVLSGTSLLAVLPITVRNYVVFRRFVPVSINLGIVLWEGIADAGGERFGAVRTDPEVARQEARLHDDPRYRVWWAAPDGIERDRARIERSLRVIGENPGWFALVTVRRLGQMLDYAGESPPLVGERAQAVAPRPHQPAPPSQRWNAPGRTRGLEPRLARGIRAPGEWLSWLAPLARVAQAALRKSLSVIVLLGVMLAALAAPRRSLVLGSVPLAFLLMQSPLHLEFRVTLPMHAVLLLFAACACLMVAGAARRIMGAPRWT